MSEFTSVMHEWGRMCAATSFCEVCPLKDEKCWATSPANMVGDPKSIESIIMSWAAEHPEPEPVYPSVAKYLEQFGIIIRRDGTLQTDFFKAHEPMSADIAQKLGLQPKEG